MRPEEEEEAREESLGVWRAVGRLTWFEHTWEACRECVYAARLAVRVGANRQRKISLGKRGESTRSDSKNRIRVDSTSPSLVVLYTAASRTRAWVLRAQHQPESPYHPAPLHPQLEPRRANLRLKSSFARVEQLSREHFVSSSAHCEGRKPS